LYVLFCSRPDKQRCSSFCCCCCGVGWYAKNRADVIVSKRSYS